MAKPSMNFWRILYILFAFTFIYMMTGWMGVGLFVSIILLVGILTIVMNWLIGD